MKASNSASRGVRQLTSQLQVAALLILALAGASPAVAELQAPGPDGSRVEVVASEAGPAARLVLADGTAGWEVALQGQATFLTVSELTGATLVGAIRFGEGESGAEASFVHVIDAAGEDWLLPGTPRLAHLAPGGDRVLVRTSVDGVERARVYTASGELVAELDDPLQTHDLVAFSADGSAVALSSSPDEAPALELVLFELDTGVEHRLELPEALVVKEARALDSRRWAVVGGGFARVLEVKDEAALGDPSTEDPPPLITWSRQAQNGYASLADVDPALGWLLLKRPLGAFDLLTADEGRLLWSFDPVADAEKLALLFPGDPSLPDLQPRYNGLGGLDLEDRDGATYRLSWSSTEPSGAADEPLLDDPVVVKLH